jgi:hypothetical protein
MPITAITISRTRTHDRLWIRTGKPRKTPSVQWPATWRFEQPRLMLEALDTYEYQFPKQRDRPVWRFIAYTLTHSLKGDNELQYPQQRIRITKPLLPNDIKRGGNEIQPITFDEAYDLLRCHVQLLLT